MYDKILHHAVAFALAGSLVSLAQQPSGARPAARPAAPTQNFLFTGKAPDPEAVERGQKVYVATCGFCHGSSAKGGEGGPDLVRAVTVAHDEEGSILGPIVQKGRQGMPAFPNVTLDQVKDISAFLHSRTQAAANRFSYKILEVVTGDARAGEAYFGQKCASCHSPTGDLAHIGSKFTDASNLQNKFLYPAARGPFGGGPPSKPTVVTVKTHDGRTITGNLQYHDDFTLALRDAQGEYHSFDPAQVKFELKDPYAGHIRLLPEYTDKNMHDILAYLVSLK